MNVSVRIFYLFIVFLYRLNYRHYIINFDRHVRVCKWCYCRFFVFFFYQYKNRLWVSRGFWRTAAVLCSRRPIRFRRCIHMGSRRRKKSNRRGNERVRQTTRVARVLWVQKKEICKNSESFPSSLTRRRFAALWHFPAAEARWHAVLNRFFYLGDGQYCFLINLRPSAVQNTEDKWSVGFCGFRTYTARDVRADNPRGTVSTYGAITGVDAKKNDNNNTNKTILKYFREKMQLKQKRVVI